MNSLKKWLATDAAADSEPAASRQPDSKVLRPQLVRQLPPVSGPRLPNLPYDLTDCTLPAVDVEAENNGGLLQRFLVANGIIPSSAQQLRDIHELRLQTLILIEQSHGKIVQIAGHQEALARIPQERELRALRHVDEVEKLQHARFQRQQEIENARLQREEEQRRRETPNRLAEAREQVDLIQAKLDLARLKKQLADLKNPPTPPPPRTAAEAARERVERQIQEQVSNIVGTIRTVLGLKQAEHDMLGQYPEEFHDLIQDLFHDATMSVKEGA